MPKLYKKLIDIIALLCLAAVFLFTFSYLKSWWTEEIGEKRQEQNIWKEKRTGTWCTIKSNSLDGVPIYDEARMKEKWGLLEGEAPYTNFIWNAIWLIKENWLWDTKPKTSLSTV